MLINFPKIEQKILKFWQENKIFEKSIEQRAKARNFVFYEGPPTANAKPGIHHVLARIYKDIICRYKTMQGFKVERKAGWDTHGLPVELEIEKKLGLKSKKDIEKYGIAKFNQKCKESVWQYKKDWEKLTERIGFWLDMENPYITYTPEYIETLWQIIKQIYQKGFLYQDYKVVPYCPRCGTSLSSHEVALGYKKIKEPAIFVKFQIPNSKLQTNSKFQILNHKTYFLVWTTTPWTLPGNVAIAVNPNFTYSKIKTNGEILILAKERIKACDINGKIIDEIQGKELLSLEYEPLYKFIEPDKKSWFIVGGDFVSIKDGTGLVHMAPAFGEEDMAVGKENNLPVLLNVDEEGKFKSEVRNWAGLYVKDADPLIIEDLKNRNLLFKEELYEHDYPFCWRCDSPLLYYAKESWFINMQKVKEDLIENNQKINWIPAHLKEGRFGEWLREIKDWALSRERYWGTPLPIWQCQKCGYREIIGSKEDLISQKFSNNRYLLLRHGHSIMNEKEIIISTLPEKIKCLLTEKGEKETREAVKKLKTAKIDLIISSDLLRTRQTAEIIGKELGIEPIFDKRLRDIQAGIYEGKTLLEFQEFWGDFEERFTKRPEGGESYNDVKKRIYQFLKEIDRKYNGKRILLVGHQRVFAMLEGAIRGLPTKEFFEKIEPHKIKTGELREIEFKSLPYNEDGELDFHRPYIDEIKFYCPHCGAQRTHSHVPIRISRGQRPSEGYSHAMKRVPEVIDCWFDSGSMPFAQYHYPFENPEGKPSASYGAGKKLPFPSDFICEAVDQTRGWFYTLLAISTLLGKGPAYKNVISLGHVLDEKGEKMSKSKGNVVDPWLIVEKYGADATRWYFYTVNQPGDSKLFSEKDVGETLKRFIITLWNCYTFFGTYGASSKLKIRNSKLQLKTQNLLDRWIISRLNKLVLDITNYLDKYNVTSAGRLIEDFVVEDLSQWYIRRSRKRFRLENEDFRKASQTLNYILLTLSKLTAPFIPFLSEEIYRKIFNFPARLRLRANSLAGGQFSRPTSPASELAGGRAIFNSVHLEDWPKVEKGLINQELEEKMKKVREIVAMALAERAKVSIKVRQPLSKLKIKNEKLKIDDELINLIKEEVNVKEIVFDEKLEKEIELTTEITPELREEGIIREVIRNIQEMRKKANLTPKDRILIQYSALPSLSDILKKNQNTILKETLANSLEFISKEKASFDEEKEIMINQEKLWLAIKKL